MAGYVQTNLVSDLAGLAQVADPLLKNPWGISHSATSPFWVSDQASQVATLFSVDPSLHVTIPALVVSIPGTTSGPQGPTGQVFASVPGAFTITNGLGASAPSVFIFANLNGTISGWNPAVPLPSPSTQAFIGAQVPGAVYTGLTLATSSLGPTLYSANGAQNRIDTFDSSFSQVQLAGNFVDPNLPAGFVPFNVRTIGGNIYVTYAPAGRPAQTIATEGQGAVAVFDANGHFLQELIAVSAPGNKLAAPWGIVQAPSSFGEFGGDLLVGNFSFDASEINAFDPVTGALEGTIPISTGAAASGGLWALDFGTGGGNGSPDTLFFTDGINHEADGLFGAISAVPEPGSVALLSLGLGVLAILRVRRT